MTERYLAQKSVGEDALAHLVRIESVLRGNDLKAFRHRAQVLERDARRPIEESVKKWGPEWARTWAGRSLRDRAREVDLEYDYDSFYGSASLPTHVGGGGLFGTLAKIEGKWVNRYGPALALCPIALLYGLAYLRIVAERLSWNNPH